MNRDELTKAIHRYAEDREIGYLAAQNIVENYTNHKITTQKEMVDWKQLIDKYLKTFEEKDFLKVESKLKELKSSD